MARGIEGMSIFADDEDHTAFLQILTESLSIAGHKCYAWVMLNNHYHLLLRCNDEPIGIMMRRLNSKYARYFSRKYNRRARVARYHKEGWDVSRPAELVSEKVGIQPAEIQKRTKDKTINDARKMFCYIGSKILEMPKSERGRYLGISTPGVWRAGQEGKRVVGKRGMIDLG